MQTVNENNVKEVLNTLQQHPITQKILEEKQQAIIEQRKLAFSELKTLRTEQNEKLKILHYKITKTEKALEVSQQEAKRAAQEHQKAQNEKFAASLDYSSRIQRLESTLQETADPQIDEGIKFFNERLDALRKPEAIKQQHRPGYKDLYTEKRKPFGYSNYDALNNTIAYLQGAVKEAQEMKLQDLTSEEIKKRLDELKANTPAWDALTYYGE